MKGFGAIISCFLLLSACSPERKLTLKKQPYDNQDTLTATEEQILNQLAKNGDLEGTKTSSIDPSFQVILNKNGEKFFVRDKQVVSWIKKPSVGTPEEELIYWRQLFEGRAYREYVWNGPTPSHHSSPYRVLACDTAVVKDKTDTVSGRGVIYDSQLKKVVRVFAYDLP